MSAALVAQGKMVEDLLNKGREEIAKALPEFIKSDRFIRTALTEVRNNPMLQDCDPVSICTSIMKSAQLGLEIGAHLGEGYLIPYRDRKTGKSICTFQIGYKGKVSLVRRSGQVSEFYCEAVYEGDEFEYEKGLDRKLRHKPMEKSRKLTHVYAVCVLKDGAKEFDVMTRSAIEAHRDQYSKRPDGDAWKDSFDEMAKKVVVSKICKLLPKAIEFPEPPSPLHYERIVPKSDPEKFAQISAAPDIVPPEDRGFYLSQLDDLLAQAASSNTDVRTIVGDLDKLSKATTETLIAVVAMLKEKLGHV